MSILPPSIRTLEDNLPTGTHFKDDVYIQHTPEDVELAQSEFIKLCHEIGLLSDKFLEGKVHRQGISHATTACGAAVGAYNAVKADKSQGDFRNGYHDHQMDCIKHLLVEHVDSIVGQENEMAVLAYKMYDIIEKYLDSIVNLKFCGPNSKLAILGGIMINCDGKRTDCFLPLKFEVRSLNGTTDYTEECFGFRNHRYLLHKAYTP